MGTKLMKIEQTIIEGVYIIKRKPIYDNRGMFERLFCKHELEKIQKNMEIVQINRSINNIIGTVRGMHFQYPPRAEDKYVSCIKGGVFDVVVDLRKGSDTLLKWFGTELTETNYTMIHVPKGCAHGFQVLQKNTELIYFHTEYYSPEHEGSIRHDDPSVRIKWLLPISEISEKDQNQSFLDNNFSGIGQ